MQFENQFSKVWFDGTAPLNATPAKYVIGESGNTLTISYGENITGNGTSIVVAVAETASADMTAAFEEGVLTITLGTDATESPITVDDTKNTYALIAAAIKEIEGFDAVVAGEGVIDAAAESDDFTDGWYGTIQPVPGTLIKKSNSEWYTNLAPNSKFDANWVKLTVATY